jgi:hypothetical protein
MVDSAGLVLVGIVSLWLKDQIWSKFRITPQHFDAFDDIMGIKLKCFSRNDHLSAFKFWPFREFLVDDPVKFP